MQEILNIFTSKYNMYGICLSFFLENMIEKYQITLKKEEFHEESFQSLFHESKKSQFYQRE